MYMHYLIEYGLNHLLNNPVRKELQAQNTYILTLDGDVDFKPDAVTALVERMRSDTNLGSVCGRVHPLGSGEKI